MTPDGKTFFSFFIAPKLDCAAGGNVERLWLITLISFGLAHLIFVSIFCSLLFVFVSVFTLNVVQM